MLREGLRRILEDGRTWQVVAEAGNGRDAVHETLALKPDVAILDIGMPLLNGIEATRQIVRRVPSTRVVLLSMHREGVYVTQAVRCGAWGYVSKGSAGDELVDAVAAMAAGRTYFNPPLTEPFADHLVDNPGETGVADRFGLLTERARQSLQLVADGRSGKQVGELLSISPATVGTHRANLLHKLGLPNVVVAVRDATRRGLIQ